MRVERVDFVVRQVWERFIRVVSSGDEEARCDLDARPGGILDRRVVFGAVDVELADDAVESPGLALDEVSERGPFFDCDGAGTVLGEVVGDWEDVLRRVEVRASLVLDVVGCS